MAKLKSLRDKDGGLFYPLTHMEAVVGDDGKTAGEKLTELGSEVYELNSDMYGAEEIREDIHINSTQYVNFNINILKGQKIVSVEPYRETLILYKAGDSGELVRISYKELPYEVPFDIDRARTVLDASFVLTIERQEGKTSIKQDVSQLGNDVQALKDGKVDVVEGKQLSSNDYTDTDKQNLDNTTKTVENVISSETIKSKNLHNPFTDSHDIYINANGVEKNSEIYNTTSYIDCKPNEAYVVSGNSPNTGEATARLISYYDKNKHFLLRDTNKVSFVVPEGAYFFRVSYYKTNTNYQIELGHTATSFEQYYESTEKYSIDASIVTGSRDSVTIANKGLTALFDLAEEEYVLGSNSVKTNKTLSFSGEIVEWNENSILKLGHGRSGEYLASWIELSQTKAVVKRFTSTEKTVRDKEHGLAIANNIQIKVEAGTNGEANIAIVSNGAEYITTATWDGCHGDIWVMIENGALSCSLGWYCKNLSSDTWIVGASYTTHTTEDRWPYYLIKDGHIGNLQNGFPGQRSEQMKNDLINLLQIATPKRLIWSAGGNDRDNEDSVNQEWLDSYNVVKDICAQKGIEFIPTIYPNVIGGISDDDISGNNGKFRSHNYQREIVINSGYRYIDLAKPVGANAETGLWYGTTASDILNETGAGMLSKDGVHPTVLGAKAMYYYITSVVPELCS